MPVQSLQTVENAMVVLEKVAENQPIGVSALARLLDMDKNTAQRLLVTLGRQGWISQDGPKGSWSLTGRVIKVAARVSWRMAERARPLMSSLLASTQESVTLWKLDGQPGTWWCTLVDIIESPHALRMGVPMGTTFDLNSTPGSKYDVQPHFARFPDGRTAWGTPRVDQAPRYWVHDRSYPSATTIGSIIYDGPGAAIGTIAVLGPKTRIDPSRHQIIGEEVATAARLISGL
jgi:IclR family acetate operon transcriptional repressor